MRQVARLLRLFVNTENLIIKIFFSFAQFNKFYNKIVEIKGVRIWKNLQFSLAIQAKIKI